MKNILLVEESKNVNYLNLDLRDTKLLDLGIRQA